MNHGTSSVQEFSQRAGKVNAREHSELFGEEPAGKKAKIGEASRPKTHRTKLHNVVSTRDKTAVSRILRNGSNLIDVQEESSKMTALHIAATRGYSEIVSLLLSAGSDVHLQNKSGMTALHIALKHEHEETAKVIIDAGAKNNIQDKDGKTALHYAAERNYVEIVKRLIASGADTRLQDRSGMTALHVTLKECCKKSAEVLIEADAESIFIQDKNGKTALHYAAGKDFRKIVKRLLTSGADTRLQDRSGMTALHVAVKESRKKSAAVLIEADTESSYIQDKDGKTALHFAAARNCVEIVKSLLASGADTRLQDRSGMTALHVALKNYSERTAEVLIEADAESSYIQDKNGKTALHYAAETNFREIVKRLLVSGTDTRLQDRSGMTALHVAMIKHKKLSAEVLIEADAESSNIQDKDGKTGLHRAIESFHVDAMLRQLLFHEVNPHVSDNKGQFPLKAALDPTVFWLSRREDAAKLILSMCVLRSIDIDWKELDLGHDRTTYCAGLLSEFEAELRRMKQTKLRGTNLSYHDFVRGHVSRVARYLENENARSVLLVDDAALRFPSYGEFFTFKVRRAEKRRILNNKCLQCFAVLPTKKKQPSLPRICTDLILAHLSEREMQNFIASFRVKC